MLGGVLVLIYSDNGESGGLGDDAAADMATSGNVTLVLGSPNDRRPEASGPDSGISVTIYGLRNASITADVNITLVPDGQSRTQHGDGIPLHVKKAGTLTGIPYADTLVIDDEMFRLSLIDAPGGKQREAAMAMALVEAVCRVGSTVYYDIDDLQPKDRHGRHLALVWCGDMQKPMNQVLLETGHARLLREYCDWSEFGDMLCKNTKLPDHIMVPKGHGRQ